MDLIHNAQVSWPLGVRSSSDLNRSNWTVRKPRAKTAPTVRINFRERKPVKRGDPIQDLTPRTHRILQKRGTVSVQPGVPVLRDVLEILTCNSSGLKQSRAHSADRVSILQRTVLRRGLPLTPAEVALKSSRRFRHPDRLEANLPVSTVRLVKSARPIRNGIQTTENTVKPSNTISHQFVHVERDVSDNESDKENKKEPNCDNVEEDEIENDIGDTDPEQIINVVDDSFTDSLSARREDVPTISSGAAGAPPTPPSTPEHQKRPPVTPVEKALKHNSATYSYRRHQRKSRAQSILETKRIIYQTNVETLTPFPSMKARGYSNTLDKNTISQHGWEQLQKHKNQNNNQEKDTIAVSRPRTASSVYKSQRNDVPNLENRKSYVTFTSVRPFTKPSVPIVCNSVNYSPSYVVKSGENSKQEKVHENSQNVPNSARTLTDKPSHENGYRRKPSARTCAPESLDKHNTGGKTIDSEELGKSLRVAPIVIPCASIEPDDKLQD